jgi:membrane peptidoglycan carboxypeptidase
VQAVPNTTTTQPVPSRLRWRRRRERTERVLPRGARKPRTGRFLLLFAVGATLGMVLAWESDTSRLQARALTRIAQRSTFTVEPGLSRQILFPKAGPYDVRLGYTKLPEYVRRLTEAGYDVERQARFSPTMFELASLGVSPIYREKNHGGLAIIDGRGRKFFQAQYPARTFESFDDIPRVMVESLLYVENRELLRPGDPHRNPAVEWSRLGRAAVSYGMELVDPGRAVPGGSTLATQMEKFRHSPGGVTMSPADKLRQMVTASLRAYRYGEITARARQEIVVDYMNSISFAARPGYGEVIGLPMGLALWYGVDPDETLRLISERNPSFADLPTKARAYRQVLSLLLAARRPTEYLIEKPEALRLRTETYLKLLAEEGIISARVRDEALKADITPGADPFVPAEIAFGDRGAARSIRNRLTTVLGAGGFYELDRLDLTVESTVDEQRREAISNILESIKNPETAKTLGLTGERLLAADGAGADKVVYSFTLYERGEGVNRLRVHADTLGSALDVNDAVMLDLGSTAKLRTLVTYLEVFAELHGRLVSLSEDDLEDFDSNPNDSMTKWSIERLRKNPGDPLAAFLDAAMERDYSGSPHEAFFTGGGLHYFHNFDDHDDHKRFTVTTAFRNSVNLVFIRMMRDVVHYHMYGGSGAAAEILEDPNHWLRPHYVARFADRESRQYFSRFYRRYAGKTPGEIVAGLGADEKLSPRKYTVMLRVVRPELERDQVIAEVMKRFEGNSKWKLTDKLAGEIYENADPQRWQLNDLGFLTKTHPLEIWAAQFAARNPGATVEQALAESSAARRQAYKWLLEPRRPEVQTGRIRQELEVDAFRAIHARWKRVGYPFRSLVPSYATSIGSSADRPEALAELLGIISSDGVRQRAIRIERLRFAEGTPYETLLAARRDKATRVLPSEVTTVVRRAMEDVVQNGTGRRVYQSIHDPEGNPVAIGGKTGTGDHVRKTVGARGEVLKSEAVSRTATFAFLLGDRFYGVIGAYVKGPESADYKFTSALATQVFKLLTPALAPLLEPEPEPGPKAPTSVG